LCYLKVIFGGVTPSVKRGYAKLSVSLKRLEKAVIQSSEYARS